MKPTELQACNTSFYWGRRWRGACAVALMTMLAACGGGGGGGESAVPTTEPIATYTTSSKIIDAPQAGCDSK